MSMWMTKLMTAMPSMDYDMDYSMEMYGGDVPVYSDELSTVLGSLIIFVGVLWLVAMAVLVIGLIANWKMFVKAGKPGWAALVPFYNMYTMFDIVYPGNGIKFLFLLVPFYNIYVSIKFYIDLAKAFGKPPVFAVGLLFLNVVFVSILGFGSATYQGEGTGAQASGAAMTQDEAMERLRNRNQKPPFEG